MTRTPEELRELAVRRIGLDHLAPPVIDGSDTIVRELHVHQVELEIQNAELRDAQALLEGSRARYADLFDFAPIAYLTLDHQGCVQEINLNGAALLGYERADALGKPFASLVSFAEPAALFSHLRDCFSRSERAVNEWTFTRRRDGETVVVRAMSAPQLDGTERPKVALTALIDITSQRSVELEREAVLERERAARAAIEHSNRLKDDFLSVASHELRTPLNAIVGWATIIEGTDKIPSQVAHGASVILRNARAQTRMVDNVLDLARLKRGALYLEEGAVNFAELVNEAVESATPAAEGRTLVLTIEGSVRIWGDADRLQQVLWNLLTNAFRFTDAGGRVDVELGVERDVAVLSVRDTGCGIAPSDLSWIFDEFRQVSRGTKRKHGGLGIGLSIVRKIVEGHGGRVVAESAGVGHGATFKVSLPLLTPERLLELEEASRAGRSEGVAKELPLAGISVLVVDDDADALDLSAEMLRAAGATVYCASSARAAFDALSKREPRCIVSDLGMPGEDGFDFMRRLRASPYARLPAVALTAYSRPEDVRAATSAGFDSHVPKPIHPDHLIATVAALATGRKG